MSRFSCSAARFREAEVQDLACSDQIVHRARDIFDGHGGIDAMLIEQIDAIGLQMLPEQDGRSRPVTQ